MENKALDSFITAGYIPTLSVITALIFSFCSFWLYSFGVEPEQTIYPLSIEAWIPGNILSYIINQIIIITCALLLSRINNLYALIRSHTNLPIFFFLLFQCCNPSLAKPLNSDSICTLLFILCLFILFGAYQKNNSQKYACGIALLITTGAFLNPLFIYFIPIFCIGLYYMRSLSAKSVLALLLGIIIPFYIIFSISWVFNRTLNLQAMYTPLLPPFSLEPENYTFDRLIRIIPTALVGLFCAIVSIRNNYNNKIRTRAYNRFINTVSVILATFIFFRIELVNNYILLLNVCVAIQASHFFTNTKTRFASFLFYIVLVIYLTSFIWILLQG